MICHYYLYVIEGRERDQMPLGDCEQDARCTMDWVLDEAKLCGQTVIPMPHDTWCIPMDGDPIILQFLTIYVN